MALGVVHQGEKDAPPNTSGLDITILKTENQLKTDKRKCDPDLERRLELAGHGDRGDTIVPTVQHIKFTESAKKASGIEKQLSIHDWLRGDDRARFCSSSSSLPISSPLKRSNSFMPDCSDPSKLWAEAVDACLAETVGGRFVRCGLENSECDRGRVGSISGALL